MASANNLVRACHPLWTTAGPADRPGGDASAGRYRGGTALKHHTTILPTACSGHSNRPTESGHRHLRNVLVVAQLEPYMGGEGGWPSIWGCRGPGCRLFGSPSLCSVFRMRRPLAVQARRHAAARSRRPPSTGSPRSPARGRLLCLGATSFISLYSTITHLVRLVVSHNQSRQ